MIDDRQHREECLRTILTLDRRIWRQRMSEPRIAEFETQFDGSFADQRLERILAIELLSRFTYYGDDEVKSLVRSLYRDHYRYPLIEEHREQNADTVDRRLIVDHIEACLNGTRFMPLGESSGSGSLIAYHFRTQNSLPQSLFSSPSEIMDLASAELRQIRRLVVLDDICGSGGSALRFASRKLSPIASRFQAEGFEQPALLYLALCGTEGGLQAVREGPYARAEAAVFFDVTYRVCGPESRYFGERRNRHGDAIDLAEGTTVLRGYGERLFPAHPLGFNDGQLLIGFAHNVPNNSLPVMWSTAGDPPWLPPFERHGKNPCVADAAARLPS